MLIDLLHKHIQRRYRQLGFEDMYQQWDRFTIHCYQRNVHRAKDTLVLVHGLGTSSSTWVHILPDLAPMWNVLAVDLPGFGFSTIDAGEPLASLPEHVGALAAAVEKTLRHPFLLLGHSLGGWIAGLYAIEHPSRVAHLILADSAGILCDDTVHQAKAFQIDSISDLHRLLDKLWLHYPWYLRLFSPAVLHDMRKRNVRGFIQSIGEDDFLNPHLRELTGKVTVVWGRQDRLISLDSVEVLKKAIPGIEVHFIEDCGHVPQLERPGKFANVLRGIMEREASSPEFPLVI